MTTPQTLGTNIRNRRNKLELTQAELSRKVGITRSYLCDIEKGRKSPTIKVLMIIADKLGVNIKKLF